MFFIFGWGRTTVKDHGAFHPMLCPHCDNERYWQLYSKTTWFTLFFIPVIPYSFKYFLLCPICEHGLDLDKRTFDDLKMKKGIYNEYLEAFKQKRMYFVNKSAANKSAANNSAAENPIKKNSPAGTASDSKHTAHFQNRKSAQVTCPICNNAQMSNRNSCFKCGCNFVFESEVCT